MYTRQVDNIHPINRREFRRVSTYNNFILNTHTLKYLLRQVNHLKRLNIYPIRNTFEQRVHYMKVHDHHIAIDRVLLL